MHLFTAGPAQSPKIILDALASPTLHHRSQEFRSLLHSCRASLQALIPLPHLFFLCSSGSGAMESAIASFSPNKILVLEHGKFSRRWFEIANALDIHTNRFRLPPHLAHSPQEVLEILHRDSGIDCVCLQSCESTGGVRQDFECIAQAIKSHNPDILVCIDGIASIAIEPIDTTHIDIFIASSQKALMLPVGLGFVFLSDYAFRLLDSKSPKSHYLALQNYKTSEIPFSLPSSLFKALQTSLSLIDAKTNYALIEKRFLALLEIFNRYGVQLFSLTPSKGIIAFIDENEIIKSKLGEQKILISSGQDALKNHISRIGNFGILQEFEPLLEKLEKILITHQKIKSTQTIES